MFKHWNCFLSSVSTDGKDGKGLKLEKIGLTFSNFSTMPAKIQAIWCENIEKTQRQSSSLHPIEKRNRFIRSLIKRARELILLRGSQNVTLVGKWLFVRLYTNLKSPSSSKPTSPQGFFLYKIGKALKTRLDENNHVYDKDLQRSCVSPGQKKKQDKTKNKHRQDISLGSQGGRRSPQSSPELARRIPSVRLCLY